MLSHNYAGLARASNKLLKLAKNLYHHQETPVPQEVPGGDINQCLRYGYVFCLKAFLSWGDIKLHPLPLSQGTKAIAFDVAVVDENIVALLTLNEPKAFLIIEPFYGSGFPV